MAINIEVVSNVSKFIKGANDIDSALEDNIDSFDDAGKAGKDLEKDLERNLKSVRDEVKDTTDTTGRKFRDVFDDVKDDSKKSFKKVEDDAKDGFHKAGKSADDFKGEASEATSAFKDEAGANFAETASSFDGSMESVADMAQSVFGGMADKAGPIGLVAAAGALAFGALYNSFQANAEKIEARANDMYADLMESGLQFLSDSFVQDEVDKIVTGAEDAAVSLSDARGMADDLGLSVSDVVAAFAGSASAQDVMLTKIAETRTALGQASQEGYESYAGEIMQLNDIERAIQGQQGALAGVADKTAIARQAAYDYTHQYDDLKTAMDNSIGYYGGRDFGVTVTPTLDTTQIDRDIRRLTDGAYEIRVNGRVTGMRYE